MGQLVGPTLSEKQTQTLRGLANNSQGHCQYVRRFTVRSCSLHKSQESSDVGTSSLNSTLNALLGSALRHMVNLRHLGLVRVPFDLLKGIFAGVLFG